jgi:hypothetical protein
MIDKYEKWLKDRNFSSGTIRMSVGYAKRIIKVYPDCKLPDDIYEVSEHSQIDTSKCTGTRGSHRSHIRRFAEFLGHEFK